MCVCVFVCVCEWIYIRNSQHRTSILVGVDTTKLLELLTNIVSSSFPACIKIEGGRFHNLF
jgi:hypothetical protein